MDEQQFTTPESQRRAIRKYLAKFKEIRVRVLPDEHAAIVAHAKAMGDKSTVAFIMRAIREAMERDRAADSEKHS